MLVKKNPPKNAASIIFFWGKELGKAQTKIYWARIVFFKIPEIKQHLFKNQNRKKECHKLYQNVKHWHTENAARSNIRKMLSMVSKSKLKLHLLNSTYKHMNTQSLACLSISKTSCLCTLKNCWDNWLHCLPINLEDQRNIKSWWREYSSRKFCIIILHSLHHLKHPHSAQSQIQIHVSQHTPLGQPAGRQKIRGDQHCITKKLWIKKNKERKILSRQQRWCF